MRRPPASGGKPARALVAGVALLVGLQWYGPGGYSHIKFGQHQKQAEIIVPAGQAAPPAPAFGPYEMYGPFRKSAG